MNACRLIGHERAPKARCRWCGQKMGGDEEALNYALVDAFIERWLFRLITALPLTGLYIALASLVGWLP